MQMPGPGGRPLFRREPGHVLAEYDIGQRNSAVQAIIDHGLRPGAELFGRLEDHDKSSRPHRPHLGQLCGCANETGNMHIVPTGVHDINLDAFRVPRGNGAAVRQAGSLFDGKRIHIGAQEHNRTLAVAEHADHARTADLLEDLVSCPTEVIRRYLRRPLLGEREFRISVQVLVQLCRRACMWIRVSPQTVLPPR